MQIRAVVHRNSMNHTEKTLIPVRGFTLIELIVYIALVSLFVTSAIFFTWDVIYGREKAYQNQLIEQNIRIALARVAYEIRRATNVQSVSANQIVLDSNGSSTIITHLSGRVEITSGGNGPYNLTSNQVEVTDLTFSNLSSTNNNSKNISISMTIRQSQAAVSGQLTAQIRASHSAELKGQFNMARSLLIDATGSVLSINSRNVEGLILQDASTSDITIDQLTISWTGIAGGINITEVQIGGGAVEWVGSQGSGSTLNLADYTLLSGITSTAIDYLQFDGDMSGATLELSFTFTDGSTVKARVTPESLISASPSPTPSPGTSPGPTPTPTPTAIPTTCIQICINNSYSSGTCRQNAQNCTNNGQIHLPAGNAFCTGGPNTDTCCCTP